MVDKTATVLVVDDSRMFAQVVVQNLEQIVTGRIFAAGSLAETAALVQAHEFDVAMLDLNLPDAPSGEVVDLVLGRGIPVIVFAGDCTDQTRKRLWSKNIVDYVVKEGGESLRYAVRQARRIIMNRELKVLVVEDSVAVRGLIASLLRVHRYQVLEAGDGREGLHVLRDHPDIRLIITDYEMPEMDGVTFIRRVREHCPKEELAIIGISSHELEFLSARFLKSGANDFLSKPFSSEEFYCRVSQNMDLLEYIRTIKEYSERDFLTGLCNRRYLFEHGPARIRAAHKEGKTVHVAMLDIDHFKRINDEYGHDVGDGVLARLGEKLRERFGSFGIVARLGGEEFCILCVDSALDLRTALERFRADIAAESCHVGEASLTFSLSMGLRASGTEDLEAMLKKADELLYTAKAKGRNRLEFSLNANSQE
jgi:diguanylate cyclase (GGDEF)-like protein